MTNRNLTPFQRLQQRLSVATAALERQSILLDTAQNERRTAQTDVDFWRRKAEALAGADDWARQLGEQLADLQRRHRQLDQDASALGHEQTERIVDLEDEVTVLRAQLLELPGRLEQSQQHNEHLDHENAALAMLHASALARAESAEAQLAQLADRPTLLAKLERARNEATNAERRARRAERENGHLRRFIVARGLRETQLERWLRGQMGQMSQTVQQGGAEQTQTAEA